MQTFATFALLGIRLRITVDGAFDVCRLFPSLHELPRAQAAADGWRITAIPDRLRPRNRDAVPKEGRHLRVSPGVDLVLWEEGNVYGITAEGAVATLCPTSRRAELRFRPTALQTAERVGRVLVMEILRCEGRFTLHAGAVETNGGSVLICGPSGSGKSTLAATWACLGNARFMAEDRCLIYKRDGYLWAGGIPDEIGLRRGTVALLDSLGVRVPALPGLRYGKYSCNVHDLFLSYCRNPCPLRAIVFLSERTVDSILAQTGAHDAIQRLLDGNLYVGHRHTTRDQFSLMAELAVQVPAYLVPAHSDTRAVIAALDTALAGPGSWTGAPDTLPLRHSRRVSPLRRFDARRRLFRLLSGEPAALRRVAFDESQWVEIVRAADAAGLLASLSVALDGNTSLLACREPVPNVLRVARLRAITARERHLAVLERITLAFNAEHFHWVVVDGPGLAEGFYSPPWSKAYVRIDLAVDAVDIGAARRLLGDLLRPDSGVAAPCRFLDAEQGIEIRLLDPATVRPAWLHRAVPLVIRNTRTPVLAPKDQLLVSCQPPARTDAGAFGRQALDIARIWRGMTVDERAAFAETTRRQGPAEAAGAVLLGRVLKRVGQTGSQARHCGVSSA